ncbi:MAG: oxidoreductase [Trebouxia sp. A1-2]|nr:MAG: oxidoreductase [Trebouxia sp. A1-2]
MRSWSALASRCIAASASYSRIQSCCSAACTSLVEHTSSLPNRVAAQALARSCLLSRDLTRDRIRKRAFASMAHGEGGEIRVGIIGAGGNTKKLHIPNLQKINGVQVVSVANRSLESSKKAAAEFGISKAAASWPEVIQDPEVDAIVIGTWPYLHHTLVLAALAANKHVLTEARLAMNAQEAREMLKASQGKPNLVTQVTPSPITFTWDATIQGIIQEGKLGDLIYVEARGQSGAFPQATGSTMTWRQDVDLSGLNVMKLGIFYEALQRWVGDAIKVQALAKTVVKTCTDGVTGEPAHVQIPDHLDVLAELACGAQAHIVMSDVTGVGRTTQNEFWLYGSKGTLHLDLDAKKLSIALQEAGGKLQEVKVSAEKEGAWRVEEEFICAIRGTEQIQRTSFAAGLRYMEFTEAVAASYQTGQAVYLPLTH